jgi:hypothetical protein
MRSLPEHAKRAIAAVSASSTDLDLETLADGDIRLRVTLEAHRERLRRIEQRGPAVVIPFRPRGASSGG